MVTTAAVEELTIYTHDSSVPDFCLSLIASTSLISSSAYTLFTVRTFGDAYSVMELGGSEARI